MRINELNSPMAGRVAPTWSRAIWVGAIDLPADLPRAIALSGADGYRRARLLVRLHRRPLAFVEVDVNGGSIAATEFDAALARAAGSGDGGDTDDSRDELDYPHITVVICTRNRPEQLRYALNSVLALRYPSFNVVIVDNASDDDATVRYVGSLNDSRLTLVTERRPGLAVARNTGLRASVGELVAFTDDDVVVDSDWCDWLARSFAADSRVACVTGLVPSGELRTATQKYFEQRVHWANCLEQRTFDLQAPPVNSRLFPFRVGDYGTGANFAVRRDVLFHIGGFDEALGVGSPTGGGEDIDLFVRIIAKGYKLQYEPSAIVWHRHREDASALIVQARGYGLGLGAWMTKVALTKELRRLAVPKILGAIAHMRTIAATNDVEGLAQPFKIVFTHVISVLCGPFAYYRSRSQGRLRAPLLEVIP